MGNWVLGALLSMLNVDKAQLVLPRFLAEEASVLVGIKRKLSYNHSFMVGVVRPVKTM